MTAKIIDGNAVARAIRDECRQRVQRIVAQSGAPPGLAVILVGSDPASRIYVKNKIRACADVGIRSFRFDYPSDVEQDEVLAKIAELNEDPAVHGILVQLPLPASFDMARILHAISADKDVDGFHLYNVGGLVVGGTVFPPCTPYGVLKLLEHENISLEGKNVVVVGASNIVGKPMALMLMQHEATVCICHAKTRDLAQFTLLADVLVVAAGYPNLYQGNSATGPNPGATPSIGGINNGNLATITGVSFSPGPAFVGGTKKSAPVRPHSSTICMAYSQRPRSTGPELLVPKVNLQPACFAIVTNDALGSL